MIVYKAFKQGLVCREYQYHMGVNTTEEANCVRNGFHAAEKPFNIFDYYRYRPDTTDEYYICDAGGDIDEDDTDTKVSCTRLNIIKKLSIAELTAAELLYLQRKPGERVSKHYSEYVTIAREAAQAKEKGSIAIAIGPDPRVKGATGSVLGLVCEEKDRSRIRLYTVDGVSIKPDTWYGMEGAV